MPITNRKFEPQNSDVVYDLLDYDINFAVILNPNGLPAGKPEIESFTLRVTRDSESDNSFFTKWLNDNTTAKDADIVFYDQARRIRALSMKNTFLIDYSQASPTPGQIIETIELSPMQVTLDGVTFKRKKAS